MRCECIIPVGPGHDSIYRRATDSVRVASLAKGPFDSVGIRIADDTQGIKGRSASRNDAVRESDADVVFFLDADDVIHPFAFDVYSDYMDYDAVWGNIYELAKGVASWRYQVPRIETYEQLLAFDPYLTLQMGHFVRADIAKRNPFNEEMDTGEDWDYYLRIWKSHNCVKIPEPLFLNDRSQHSHGPRQASGERWREIVEPMLERARNESTGNR